MILTPDTERSDEGLPEDGGSDKLPEEDDGEKLPEGGDQKLPKETPAGKLYRAFVLREYFFFALNLIKEHIFPLDSQNPGNSVGMVQDVAEKAISEVRASTSQVSSRSVLPREKVELAFKLLGVSSRTL